jgi:hypothetical protein
MYRCAWLFVLVSGIAVPALAGESGSGSGESGPGSSDAGSTTAGSEGTSATTHADDESTAACGGCDPYADVIRFDSPLDDATVDGPFVVEVTVTPGCSCESCPCSEAPPEYTQLFLDTLAAGPPCYTLACSWELNPPVGAHSLYVNAVFGVIEDEGTRIDIHVASMAASSDDGTPEPDPHGPSSSSETGSASAAGTEPLDAGCGCRSSWDGGSAPFVAALLLCVGRPRRARRRD